MKSTNIPSLIKGVFSPSWYYMCVLRADCKVTWTLHWGFRPCCIVCCVWSV